MKYGYFDDERREYVITAPRTPLPWINYLGSEDFFTLISNTAGGYSFYRDARLRRLILPDAGPVRFAACYHGHMDRIGQRGKDRFHPPAESSFPEHSGQEPIRADPLCIRGKEGVQ